MWLLISWVLLTKYWLNVIKKHQLNLQIFLTPGTDARILILELFTLQLALHWMKFITHLSPINFYLTENLNLLVFLRHNVFTVDTKWVACYN